MSETSVEDPASSPAPAAPDGPEPIEGALDEQSAAMTKISSAFLLGYLLYCLIIFIMLKCFKFDLVYGLVGSLRKRQCSTACIVFTIIIYLLVIVLTPIAIAVVWAM